jgi:hypothetical protein
MQVARYIEDIEKVGGLKITDIANIAQVSKATVSRWANGTLKPQPRMQLILVDLRYVVGRLQGYYSGDEIRMWLYARHPQLEGERAVDLINQGKSECILNILDRHDLAAYL